MPVLPPDAIDLHAHVLLPRNREAALAHAAALLPRLANATSPGRAE